MKNKALEAWDISKKLAAFRSWDRARGAWMAMEAYLYYTSASHAKNPAIKKKLVAKADGLMELVSEIVENTSIQTKEDENDTLQ